MSAFQLILSFTTGAARWYDDRITVDTKVFPVHRYQSALNPGISFDVQHATEGQIIFYARNADGTLPTDGVIYMDVFVFW